MSCIRLGQRHLFRSIYIWSPFSAIKTISVQADCAEGSTVPQHILNKRYGRTIVLFWNKFHLKPIRSSVCDCQHCLANTRAKWVFLHRLIKRHYCSLMSSSPCLSVRCVDYNCYHSFPLKSTLLLGMGCKGLFLFLTGRLRLPPFHSQCHRAQNSYFTQYILLCKLNESFGKRWIK